MSTHPEASHSSIRPAIEQVGVIPRALAASLELLGHGFTPLRAQDTLQLIEDNLSFVDRPPAEQDPSRKQIIPYGVVQRGEQVFVLERLEGGGEQRLHGKISLGVGGHINPIDLRPASAASSQSIISATMRRELYEELHAPEVARIVPCGTINDDTVPVGRVHLGVVFRIVLHPSGSAHVREVDALRGEFRAWSELRSLQPRMETWSGFLVDAHGNGHL